MSLPSASLDRTVRLWDLCAGLPLAASRPHGGTVRCLALDSSLLASGCSDAAVRVWHPTRCNGSNRSNGDDGGRPALLYDVASQPYVLRGHTGPVSCLALGSSGLYDSEGCDSAASTPRSTGSGGGYGGGLFGRRRKQAGGRGYGSGLGSGSSSSSVIFSGSWDCTVRIWRRSADWDGGHWGDCGREEDRGDGGEEEAEEQEDERRSAAHGLLSRVRSAASSASSLAAGLTINGMSASSSDSLASGVSSGSGSGSSGDELPGGGGLRRGGRAKKRDESGGWGCTGVLQYSDWVYCCVARGANLLVAAGSEVVVTDACTGRCVRRFAALHEAGSVAAVEGTRNGRLLFTASADGLVLAHDLRMKQVGVGPGDSALAEAAEGPPG